MLVNRAALDRHAVPDDEASANRSRLPSRPGQWDRNFNRVSHWTGAPGARALRTPAAPGLPPTYRRARMVGGGNTHGPPGAGVGFAPQRARDAGALSCSAYPHAEPPPKFTNRELGSDCVRPPHAKSAHSFKCKPRTVRNLRMFSFAEVRGTSHARASNARRSFRCRRATAPGIFLRVKGIADPEPARSAHSRRKSPIMSAVHFRNAPEPDLTAAPTRRGLKVTDDEL
jgi:hypothetical protein